MSGMAFDGESLITPEAIATEVDSAVGKPSAEQFAHAQARLALVLNIAKQQLENGRDPSQVIDRTAIELHHMRRSYRNGVWQALIPIVQGHPVSEFFLQDPFTRWSFEKPRGYSGDAQLLDFIYGHPSVAGAIAKASPLGRALYRYTYNASSSVAVRERRDLLAKQVDEIAAARGKETEILAVACGHLREAEHSTSLREGRINRWVALDQDPMSVGAIARDWEATSVEAVEGSVRGLLADAYNLGRFDFVYAAGLYDYLSHKVAVRLTQACLRMLKPNGTFLFANFADDISVDGYMETFMNWALLLRSEAEMWNIVNASVDRNTVEASVHFGSNRNVIYATLRKRA
ncbi:class I SAM-dependent methyltransferase [Chelativorans alearense]|uniref:class I SAM-dependent methyltransferase n=1 Tax=Chelativorans alearense TaxID=2681495 RepID=UPI0013D134FF|nr:class I SAM-dependent methyltransferase [Chelativorans alearense]